MRQTGHVHRRSEGDAGIRQIWTPAALADAHLATRPDTGDVGVQRSDFIRHVVVRLMRTHWPPGSPPPTAYTPFTRDAHVVAADLIASADMDVALARAARWCRGIAERTYQQARVDDIDISRRTFSEKIAVWVGSRLARGMAQDSEADGAFVTELLDDWASRPRAMDANTFVATHQAAFDVLWERGARGYLETPPSAIDLGSDERPPLVRDENDGGRDDWTQGTDRSVHSRYRLALKPRGRPRAKVCDNADCLEPGRRADDPGQAEVERACQPWGLAEAAHRQLLLSIHAGIGASGYSGAGDWRSSLTPCSPVDVHHPVDHVVVEAMSGAWSGWCTSPVGRLLTDDLGDLAAYQHVVGRVISRRGWMNLHGRESTGRPAARRCWLRSLVSDALYHQAAPTLRRWAREGAPDDQPTRREATIDLLGRSPAVALAVRDGHAGWRESYLALVDAAGTRRAFLAPAEARSLIVSLIQAGVDDHV